MARPAEVGLRTNSEGVSSWSGLCAVSSEIHTFKYSLNKGHIDLYLEFVALRTECTYTQVYMLPRRQQMSEITVFDQYMILYGR